MSKSKPDPGAQYREAKDAVGLHRQRQAAAELARVAWLKAHRGIPTSELYDRQTGAPIHLGLAALETAVTQAVVDVRWCRALVVACGEVVKGCRFEDVPNGPRPTPGEVLARTTG